jgi:tetratricopeptide (TPR) repeat protein
LISSGWSRHADHPEDVAAELESQVELVVEAAQAGGFLGLANHTIGEHLGDWPRAKKLASQIVERHPQTKDLTGALMSLALAHFMAGDWVAALARQADIVRLSGDSAAVVQIKLYAQVANALLAAGDYAQGVPLYSAVLQLARTKGETASDRSVAITSNNLASGLEELTVRTPEQTALMLQAADAAFEFWKRCGTWVNAERALYLLVLVCNAAGKPDEARKHAEEALSVIAENGEEKDDEAFIRLALANAYRLLEKRADYDVALARADELAAGFDSENMKSWYASARAKALWNESIAQEASSVRV